MRLEFVEVVIAKLHIIASTMTCRLLVFEKINGTTLQSFFLSIIVSGGDTMTYNDVSSSCVPCGLLKMIISSSHDFHY